MMDGSKFDLPPGFPVDPDLDPRENIHSPPPPERRVRLGNVVKVHGLRGDLKIVPATWNPQRFEDLDSVWVESPDGRIHWLTIKRLRFEGETVFIRFVEAATRDFAEPLVGGTVFVDESERAPLPEDMYYIDDLIGCTVIDDTRGEIGSITEVMDSPGHDIWQVDGPYGEVLIPVVHEMIVQVDIDNKRIKVDLPEGLIPEESSPDDH